MILDIICVAVVLLFSIIGYIRGFTRQVFGLFGKIVAIVGAYVLLMPVYNFLYSLFLGSIVESLGEKLAFLSFLDGIAIPAGKTTGALLSEYFFLFVVFGILVFLIGLIVKLLKLIIHPICDLKGIRFFDKLFGLGLGAVLGAVLVVGVLYLAIWLAGFENLGLTATINDIIAKISAGSFFSEEYVLGQLDQLATFFTDVWNLIKSGVDAVQAL